MSLRDCFVESDPPDRLTTKLRLLRAATAQIRPTDIRPADVRAEYFQAGDSKTLLSKNSLPFRPINPVYVFV